MKLQILFRKFGTQLVALSLLTVGAASAYGEDPGNWSQFRGPMGNGVSMQAHPESWGEDSNVAWSTEIDGGGWSSPIVCGDQIFVTTAISSDGDRPKGFGEGVSSMRTFFQSKAPDQPYSFEVHCIDLSTGDLRWKQQVASETPPHKIHPSNSYATESPATDGERVYTYFASIGKLACFDLEGEQLWSKDVGAFRTSSDFGTGSSLALHDGNVFVQCDNEEASFVSAFDGRTGEEVWRVDRDVRTSWSSPLVWKNRDRVELVVCGAGNVTSYDPASGKVLWLLTGTGSSFSASPTADEGRLYLGNSSRNSRGPLVAVNAGASGEMSLDSIGDNQVAWVEDASGPGMCSPVVVDGRVFVLSRGILSCHNAETGERIYRERLQNASSVTSSLWASDGKVFAIN
ncbi:MAG: PQQ-binding-like beta-propeller repeat protein, partial [Rubripirellula sp.]